MDSMPSHIHPLARIGDLNMHLEICRILNRTEMYSLKAFKVESPRTNSFTLVQQVIVGYSRVIGGIAQWSLLNDMESTFEYVPPENVLYSEYRKVNNLPLEPINVEQGHCLLLLTLLPEHFQPRDGLIRYI